MRSAMIVLVLLFGGCSDSNGLTADEAGEIAEARCQPMADDMDELETDLSDVQDDVADLKSTSRYTDAEAIAAVQNGGGRFLGGAGSGGVFQLDSSANWSLGSLPDTTDFEAVTISAGAFLTVPAGTTIRCRGDFTIESGGTLMVNQGAVTSGYSSYQAFQLGRRPPHPGDAYGASGFGTYDPDGGVAEISGGAPGIAIPKTAALSSWAQFRMGGGAGSGGSGSGGGLVKIYAGGNIVIDGVVRAIGSDGGFAGGAGAGGIVVLASVTAISVDGEIDVDGGTGGNANSTGGAGGGGGGGIIVLVAPSIDTTSGTLSTAGGPGGNTGTAVDGVTRIGGGGGGACGGNGGDGGDVQATTAQAAGAGDDGYVIRRMGLP